MECLHRLPPRLRAQCRSPGVRRCRGGYPAEGRRPRRGRRRTEKALAQPERVASHDQGTKQRQQAKRRPGTPRQPPHPVRHRHSCHISASANPLAARPRRPWTRSDYRLPPDVTLQASPRCHVGLRGELLGALGPPSFRGPVTKPAYSCGRRRTPASTQVRPRRGGVRCREARRTPRLPRLRRTSASATAGTGAGGARA